MSKSKAVLVAFAVALVGVVLFLVGSRLNNPPVTVVQAATAIPKGVRFSASNLRVVTIPKSAFQPGFVPALGLIVGKYARHYVPAGQYVVGPDLANTNTIRMGLRQGEMGFWTSGSLVTLGGAAPGERVDVAWVPNRSGNSKSPVVPRLLYTGVRVAAAYTSSGVPVGSGQKSNSGLFSVGGGGGAVSTVVLAVDRVEFLQLAEAAQNGSLALTADPWATANSGLSASSGLSGVPTLSTSGIAPSTGTAAKTGGSAATTTTTTAPAGGS